MLVVFFEEVRMRISPHGPLLSPARWPTTPQSGPSHGQQGVSCDSDNLADLAIAHPVEEV